MIDALYTATAGMKSQQTQINTLSNNISNMQTPGFKSQRVAFGDVAVISPEQVQSGLAPERSGGGSEILSTSAIFSAVEKVTRSFCKPSRGATSTISIFMSK